MKAGTGKSTTVKFIISALNISPEEVSYIAYTGKAADVLRQKGCPNAMTAHKLLYDSVKLPDGTFFCKPKSELDGNYKIIVVDEVSMLPINMWYLLLRHHVYILACGDPEQLPPVNKDDDKNKGSTLDILNHPHIFLDEIMRQAQESEIIRLSMAIREERPIAYGRGTETMILHPYEFEDGMYEWADQILVATNTKRKNINTTMRQRAGYGPEPCEGDKVISLSNHWDIFSTNGEANLINGTIGYLGHCYKENAVYKIKGFPNPVPVLYADFTSEIGDSFSYLNMDYTAIKTGSKYLNSYDEYKIYNDKRYGEPPLEFNYGYALTVWKAQGSEWDKVLIYEENFPWDKETHKKYLYTACTRASQKAILIRKE